MLLEASIKRKIIMSFKNRILELLKSKQDIAPVKESGANLSRLLFHLQNNNVAFITAFRSEYSRNENEKRNKILARDLANAGYSYIRIIGGYKDDENSEPVTEDSFAVILTDLNPKKQNEFFNDMLNFAKNFDQDSVLISLKNNEHIPVASYSPDGKIKYGPFKKDINIHDIEDYFTKIHGHKFRLKNFTESEEINKPNSFSTAMAYYGTKKNVKK